MVGVARINGGYPEPVATACTPLRTSYQRLKTPPIE